MLLVALLTAIGFTSPSLAQEQVFSNNGMYWEGEAAATESRLEQDQAVPALDAARNLDEHSQLILAEPDADEVARRMVPADSSNRRAQQTGFAGEATVVIEPHPPASYQTGFTREATGFAQLRPSPAGTLRDSNGQDYVVSQRLVGSTGAVSIRLHFSSVHLPAGARLHVYGLADDGAQHKSYDNAWLGDRTSFWSHTIPGDSAVVEYHAPDSGTTGEATSYTVDQVVHNVVDIFGDHDGATGSGQAKLCHRDICLQEPWWKAGNGVVWMYFIANRRALLCSGSLLNDEANSGTPYIYTTRSCISTQSAADTLEVGYFFQRYRCSYWGDIRRNRVSRLGSTLLATGGAGFGKGNFTLLRSSETPPNGVTFLGWTTADIAADTPVTGIHHPNGDFKRISFGSKTGNWYGTHRIQWARGITESGSGGSPLIINGPDTPEAQVIGSLEGIYSSCSNLWGNDAYNKFSQAWSSFEPFLSSNPRPDLIVDSVSVTNSTPGPGIPFIINVVAKNEGTGEAAATSLSYYRSVDSTIGFLDTKLATDDVGALAVGGSSAQNATVSIAGAGTWWVGACVEAVNGEAPTFNNCSEGMQVTITGTDLIVDEVRVSDTTPGTGIPFTINATVGNPGTEAAAATTLFYYRSTDATITTDDTRIATDTVGALAAGGSSQQNAEVSIADAGVYWVGACANPVDGEATPANNCSSGVRITVTAPDLIVDNVSVSNATPEAGAAFTINARAWNRGDGASAATTLRYIRSDDSIITTTADTELSTTPVQLLWPAEGVPRSAGVSIAEAGNYWVGACIDPVANESDTDNNCSTGVAVTIAVPIAPDLTIDGVSVSNTTPGTGIPFTLNATVQNSGTEAAAATTLRYFRSTDSTIGLLDTELATDDIDVLAAGGSSQQSAEVAIADVGTWWVGACAVTVNGESDTRNNCSASVQVTITAPDLIVDDVRVADATPGPGIPFTLNANVRNPGTKAAAATTLFYYRSTDATISTADTEFATDDVGALAINGSSQESVEVSIANTGTWWVGACAGPVSGEAATTNNCSSGVRITVTAPDLRVDNVSASNATPGAGVPFTIAARVRNQSAGGATATTLRYVRSPDSTITATDIEIATDPVEGLAANDSSQENAEVSIADAGVYWVGACANPVNGEATTANNCSSGVGVTVVGPPDLIVDGATVSDATPAPDAAFTIEATVHNLGVGAAAATRLRYFRSDDSTITTDDTQIAIDTISALAADGSSQQSAEVSIAETGSYWVGACVDTVSGETAENNNCSAGVQVTVAGPPDLIVAKVTVSDFTPEPGASFTINARVRNRGGGAAAATTLRYYLSADDKIRTTDTELTTDEVGGLAAAAISEQSAVVSIADAGEYWIGACIDAVAGEVARSNCTNGPRVSITAPDLTVGSISVSQPSGVRVAQSNVEAGVSFTINATVQNAGDKAAPESMLRYYRSATSTITPGDTQLATDPVDALAPDATSSESAAVSIPNTGSYWVGACVSTVSGETETGNNCSNGVEVSVTATPAPVTVPDLTVDNVSVSDTTPEAGTPFTINATVRNAGDGAADATTLFYYRSTDSTVTTADTQLATDAVNGLAPNGASAENAGVSIANTGTWWVGACVGPVSGETATTNNCSGGVQVSITAAPVTVPDLTVDSVRVSDTAPTAGVTFTINATARNLGTGASPETALRYYHSDDNVIDSADTELANESVVGLAINASTTHTAQVMIPDSGRYWIGVCIDTVSEETAADNNCSSGVQVTVKVTVPADNNDTTAALQAIIWLLFSR